ncbi:MAG: hypothetical protein EBX50_10995 [Chitinophagia bacterium]|nr:hypothetical protein [Chitinophagia bacterium]
MTIPKVLHQVWLGDTLMPEEFVKWQEGWRQLHPEWRYMLHKDGDIPSELRETIRSCKSYSSKSNVMRLYVVYKYGGVYCDTDFEWNRNIDKFLDGSAFVAKQHGDICCNAFFGAIPGHPWVKYQLDLTGEYCKLSPPWGPELMTKALDKVGTGVEVIPTKWVYPYMWFEERRPAAKFPEAYLVHHWWKSWGEG